MGMRVEHHPDVRRFLRMCRQEERNSFFAELERVCESPVERSDFFADSTKSRFALRYFRFAGFLALFGFDPGRNLIKVIECRPERESQSGRRGDPGA